MGRSSPPSGYGGRIVGAAVLIAAFTALSRLLGFVREAVFAAIFGASGDLDAYYVALGGPNLIIALASTAAVTTSVPVLSRLVAEGDPERAGRTWGSVFVVVTATVALGAAVLAVFAEQVVRVTAPGFPAERADLAAELMRIVLVGAVLVAVTNLVTGLLQSHRHFFWPAIVGVPFNLVLIAAALLFGGDSGVYAIAVGFVVGSFARVVVQLPGLRRVHAQPRLGLQLRDPYVRTALTLAPLVLIGHAISSVNTLVDRLVASTQVEGTISALNYGYRLVLLPYGLVAVALLQAMYPALGGSRRLGAPTGELHMLVRSGFGALGLLLVPAAVALLVLRDPLVELAYERGAFDSQSASLTAAAVGGYALGLLFLAWRELIARAFYAAQDARTPVMAALAGMIVNVVGDVTLGVRYGVRGLAASTTLAFGVSLLLLLVRFERKLGRGFLRKAGASTLRLGAAGALAAVTMAAVRIAFPEGGGESALVGLLAASIGAGLAVYVVALGLVGSKELRDFRTAVGGLWRGWRRPGGPRH
jgi:putative peptidoglycan lipid II flippase